MEGDKARALLARPWVQAHLTDARRALVQIDDTLYRIPLTDDNHCVFLGADRRCLIEQHEGLALKPAECQKFPFAPVQLAGGQSHYDTSAACKRVAEQLILAFRPIVPREDEPSALERGELAADEVDVALPDRIAVGMFRHMSQSDYQAWQQTLQAVLSEPDRSTEEALGHAWRQLRQQIGQSDRVPSFLLAHTSPMLAFFLRKPYGTVSWVQLLHGKHYQDLRVFGGFSVPVDKIRHVPWSRVHDAHVNAYLYQLLTRKVLLTRGGSVSSLMGMAMLAVMLIRWHAAVLAALRDETEVLLEDVTVAIRLVERYYTGHQPHFLQWFSSRWRGGLLRRLLLRGWGG